MQNYTEIEEICLIKVIIRCLCYFTPAEIANVCLLYFQVTFLLPEQSFVEEADRVEVVLSFSLHPQTAVVQTPG